MKFSVYVEMVLVVAVYAPVKTAESIAVNPSVFVTVQVNAPQLAINPPTLAAFASVQLKTAAVLLTLYVKAGEANFIASIVKVSVRHGFLTTIVKVLVPHFVGTSV